MTNTESKRWREGGRKKRKREKKRKRGWKRENTKRKKD